MKSTKKTMSLFFALALLLNSPLFALSEGPQQPPKGPGGAAYSHQRIAKTRIGAYEDKFFLFEPQDPTPKTAPVVIFLHGWSATQPEYYEGWVEHLCKRGNIVIFPCYQDTGEPIDRYTLNTIRSLKEAFSTLYNGHHVEPDRDQVSLIGHEGGGALGANVAAAAGYYKLPKPKAVMIINPSRHPDGKIASGIEMYDLSRIPEGTLLLVAVGEQDPINDEITARDIFSGADCVRSADKNYLTFLTDLHGTPALVADRWAALAPKQPLYELELDRRRKEYVRMFHEKAVARHVRCRGIDAMDWYGYWRLFDALSMTAFTGRDRFQALGNTDEQRFMGQWSDGKPIRGLLSTERP